MSPKIGRPHADNPRRKKIETRMSTEELEMLDYCCRETGKTRSEIVREGIAETYAKLRKLKN